MDTPMGSMHSKKEQTHSIDGQGSNSQDSVNGEGEEPASQLLDPPNGGLTAWLQVLGSFCLYFNTWGIVNTYGEYQTFYQTGFLSSQSFSSISWIGSIQAFLLFLVSTAAGPIYDAGYLRSLLWVGTFLSVGGMMITSVCKAYWQVFIAQGLVIGVGFGCLFLPSAVITSQYFTTRKSFAQGIASLGSSLGGVIYPIIFSNLQRLVGFGWATRVIAFIMLGTSVVSLAVMKQRFQAPTRRALLDFGAFRDTPYLLFSLGLVFGFMAIYVVFFYVQLYAIQVCGTNTNLAFYMLAIINAGSTFGRLIPNFYADKTGPLNMQIVFAFVASLLTLCLIGIRNTSGLIVFCALYGFFTGTFVSLPGPTTASLSSDLSTLGTRMGMALSSAGFGLLIGSPIAGVILLDARSWVGLQLWSGALLAISGSCMLAARIVKVGTKVKVKA